MDRSTCLLALLVAVLVIAAALSGKPPSDPNDGWGSGPVK